MKNTNVYFRILVLVATTALLSACGTSKQQTDYDFSSRVGNGNDPLSNVDPKTRPLAYCNQGSNSLLQVNTSIYKNGDTIVNDRIFLKLTKIPAYFSQSQNYIQFWKWQTNTSGQTDLGATPLKVQLVDMVTGNALTNVKTSLFWTDLQAAAQAAGVTTPADLFRRARLIVDLEDPYADYDVIRTVYYNMDNTVASELDTLIPIFDADPTKYAVESNGQTRAQILQNLHPLKSSAGLGWTATYFQTKVNEYCAPMNSTN